MRNKTSPGRRLIRPKGRIVLYVILVATLLVAVGITLFKPKSGSTLTYTKHLSSKGISLNGTYATVRDGKNNTSTKVNAGDIVTFSFVLTNKGDQAARGVSLNTGISNKLLTYVQNIHGTTGVSETTPMITIQNIVLLPNETQKISFDAQLLYSPNDYKVDIHPTLIDPSHTAVLLGKDQILSVAKVTISHMPSQVKAVNGGGQ